MRLSTLWQTSTRQKKMEQERETQALLRRQAARPRERVKGTNQIEGLKEIESLNQTGPDASSRFEEPLGSASGPDNATGPP